MHVLILGGSRNIGYYTGLRLLAQGNTVTFLLRRGNTFDEDNEMQRYLKEGRLRISVGDALKEDDVRRAWATAGSDSGEVDLVVFTVGGTPSFSLRKGFIITPANLVSACMLNLLATWPHATSPNTKLLAVTSNGLTKTSHKALPLAIKGMYTFLLDQPHRDKLGVERLIYYAAGWTWSGDEPDSTILEGDWKAKIAGPGTGWLQNAIIVRPALLTDGKCVADSTGPNSSKPPYRVEELLKGAYGVSRKDVAHFMVEGCLGHWERWNGKCASVAY